MYRAIVLTALVISLPVPLANGQAAEPPKDPAYQPTQQDILKTVEEMIEAAKRLSAAGRAQEATELLTEAQRGLEPVLTADPRNVRARVVNGELLTEARDLNAARKVFKAVLDDDKHNFRANLGLGRFYVVSRLWRQAALYLETARDVAPPDRRSEVLRLLAVSYNGQGQRQAAVSAAEQAVASDPDSIEALQLLVQIHMESEQREKALERAKDMVAAAERKRKLDMSGRQALQDLISANQTQLQTLVAYYTSLCRRDVRGRFTDQIEPGSEAEAVRVLSEIAYQSEQVAKLNWEFSYYQTLALLEPVVGFQTDQTRYLLRNNTRYLLDLGSLYLATHQDERAVEFFRAVIAVESPSDTNPAQARQNQETAREYLRQLNVPLTTQPAEPPPDQ